MTLTKTKHPNFKLFRNRAKQLEESYPGYVYQYHRVIYTRETV